MLRLESCPRANQDSKNQLCFCRASTRLPSGAACAACTSYTANSFAAISESRSSARSGGTCAKTAECVGSTQIPRRRSGRCHAECLQAEVGGARLGEWGGRGSVSCGQKQVIRRLRGSSQSCWTTSLGIRERAVVTFQWPPLHRASQWNLTFKGETLSCHVERDVNCDWPHKQ